MTAVTEPLWVEDLFLADDLRAIGQDWADAVESCTTHADVEKVRRLMRAAGRGRGVQRVRMGKLPAAVSAEHAELLARYRLDQERRGLLPSSVEHSATRLRAWARWLEPERTILNATRADVEAFLDGRRTRQGRKLNTRDAVLLARHPPRTLWVGDG